MKMTKRNYFTLLLLALIFSAPGLTAYFYYRHPQWLNASTTNEGELLTPPVLLSGLAQTKPRWRFIFWYPQNCEAACLQEVDKLARIRLALGRHLYEVDEWLVLPEQAPRDLAKGLREKDIQILALTQNLLEKLGKIPRVFIANPKGYLILSYPENAKPQAIYHDIKQLLSIKKSG